MKIERNQPNFTAQQTFAKKGQKSSMFPTDKKIEKSLKDLKSLQVTIPTAQEKNSNSLKKIINSAKKSLI